MGHGSYWWTPAKNARSLRDEFDEGDCVGRTGHFTPVRGLELARVLALQKRTPGPSNFLIPLRVAGPVFCCSSKMAVRASVCHDTCTGVGAGMGLGGT